MNTYDIFKERAIGQIDPRKINLTKYFHEFKSLAEIQADILALEEKTLEMEGRILE